MAAEPQKLGQVVSHMIVDRLLHELNDSSRSNRKTEEGKQSPHRDAQFQFIAPNVGPLQRRGQPVVAIDAKKREILGNLKNPGEESCASGEARRVRTHNFRDRPLGHAIPYEVFDVSRNEGWVSVGVDDNTAQFAAASILHW